MQSLMRTGLALPIIRSSFWRIASKIRHFFATDVTYATSFDRDIHVSVNLADYIESQIFWQGVQEGDRGEFLLLDRILEREDIFLDVGANVGIFSLFAAKRVPDGQVHAFEPWTNHVSGFQQNLLQNDFENIVLNCFGLSRTCGNLTLHVPKTWNTGMASLYGFANDLGQFQQETVEVRTLDQYVFENRLSNVSVVKIDVEGAELDVLEGARATIAKFRPVFLLELNKEHLARAGQDGEAMLRFWDSVGYSTARIEHSGELSSIVSSKQFLPHQNIFCCPIIDPV